MTHPVESRIEALWREAVLAQLHQDLVRRPIAARLAIRALGGAL
jgi:hypothetical protein